MVILAVEIKIVYRKVVILGGARPKPGIIA